MNVCSTIALDCSRLQERVFYAPFASVALQYSTPAHSVQCSVAGRLLHPAHAQKVDLEAGGVPLHFPLLCSLSEPLPTAGQDITLSVDGVNIVVRQQPLVPALEQGLGAKGPQALLFTFSLPQEAAHAVLAVVAPAVVTGSYGVQTRIPTGVLGWCAPPAEQAHSAGQQERSLAAMSLHRAWQLALASQAVGVAPLGGALTVQCPQQAIAVVGNRIATVLSLWGAGPFVAFSGQAEAALLEHGMAHSPLCALHSPGYGIFRNVVDVQKTQDALYGKAFALMGAESAQLASYCTYALCLHNAVHGVASGTVGEGAVPPAMQGLHTLGTLLGLVQDISSMHSLPAQEVLLGVLQARLLQQFPHGALSLLQQEITQWYTSCCASPQGAMQAGLVQQPLGPGMHALGLGATGQREEYDSLGAVTLAWNAPFGAQTERSRQNAAIEGIAIHHNVRFVRAMGLVKLCAVKANMHIGLMPPEKGNAIAKAAVEVVAGLWDHAFPVDRIQGGGGVGMNMNINEVLAIRAEVLLGGGPGTGRIHPNDDVNMCHSTNDLVHSAMHIAFWQWLQELDGCLALLESALHMLEEQHGSTVKLGRTCLMDALPMTLGQQISGYLHFVGKRRAAFRLLTMQCLELGMGAGGMGTGIGIAPGFLEAFFTALQEETGAAFCCTPNYFDVLQHADLYTDISGALKNYAAGLSSMARDLRMMNSGPRCGFGEIVLPAVQPGSSIMPGKINPIIPELVNQVAYLVCGNDTAITMAAEGSDIDLNVWEAVFLHGITNSAQMLCNATRLFVEKCLVGVRVNTSVCEEHAASSLALATVIAEVFGYKQGVQVAHHAAEHGCTIKQAALAVGLLSSNEAEELLDPSLLAKRQRFIAIVDAFRKKQGGRV
ncbi:lyase family protein [Desulfovibrio cuneatus]|uniref:lyase family protein n=1 Tax=Desulfovibrio cuneatus TaxID=159728 RepID=UPI00040A8501|nr:lyase family protein [Desulfovibrio cuneatus]